MAVDLFHWRSMTEAINEIQAPPSFLLDKVFTQRRQALAEDIDVDIVIGGKNLAPFVSPIEEGIVVDKLGRKMQSIKAPRIRLKKELAAAELMTVRAPGAELYVPGGGNIDAYKAQKIGAELQDLLSQITRTKEWMAAQALQGKLTVAQENLAFEIDFLLPDDHKAVLTSTDLWSDTTNSNPIKNIRTWKSLVANATGFTADIAICGSSVAQALIDHPKVQAVIKTTSGIAAGALSLEQAGNYVGRLAGVDIFEYSAEYTDVSGVAQKFIPDNSFILIASAGPFRLYHALILDLDTGASVASPFFSKSWIEKDPSVMWILAESRPLPVPHWPECMVFATVLA